VSRFFIRDLSFISGKKKADWARLFPAGLSVFALFGIFHFSFNRSEEQA